MRGQNWACLDLVSPKYGFDIKPIFIKSYTFDSVSLVEYKKGKLIFHREKRRRRRSK